jgi:hypothetical protein
MEVIQAFDERQELAGVLGLIDALNGAPAVHRGHI